MRKRFLPTALVAALLGGVLSAQAPGTRPGVAEVAVMPAALEVQPGGSARAAITVRLPEGFHMNSDKPREENLIPLTVSMEAVPAVTGATAAFPEALDLKQEGAALPLRVFEREFAIGVASRMSPRMRPPARTSCRCAFAIRPATRSSATCQSRRHSN